MYHLKIAFRNLRRNALYSWIKIIGLAVSLAAVILITLWVRDELNYDKFYKRSDNIYVTVAHFSNDGNEEYWTYTPTALSHVAKEEIPGVENACAVNLLYDLGYLEYEGRKFFDNKLIIADTSFFSLFDNTFIEGSKDHPMPDPYSVVITQKLAKKIFGDEPAFGKQLIGGNGGGGKTENYYVSGVVKDLPANTQIPYDAVFSFERSRYKNTWGAWANKNYILLKPDADKQQVAEQLTRLAFEKQGADLEGWLKQFKLQSLADSHLYSPDGNETAMASVRLFSIIAIMVLIIACINYVNLITARAAKRSREIGVRKIMGGRKMQLFMQIMNEAFILFFISFIIACILIAVSMPFYNSLTDKQLVFRFFDPAFLGICGTLLVLISLLAGVYPAMKLSAFKPIEAFRTQSNRKHFGLLLRKVLVVLQFIGTAGLIICTIVLNRQLDYIRHKELGYNKEHTFSMSIFTNLSMRTHYNSFKSELEKESSIVGVTASESNIVEGGGESGITWEGMQEGRIFNVATMGIDRNFFSLMEIPLIAGAVFTETAADTARYYLNETAVKQMGLEDPIGKSISFYMGKGLIAGVTKDFHYRHMNLPISPIIMYLPVAYWTVYVKAKEGREQEAIAAAERTWKKYDPDFPFSYQFLDERFDELYRADRQESTLFNCFAVIAILISCLGLFGLVTYTAETKTKEIGIRKVLGASIGSIVHMLSKEFVMLVCLAMLIAFPLAYYWLNNMLQDYAYRISIGWWLFAAAGLITLALTLLTVGWQALKAATANPVESIKTE